MEETLLEKMMTELMGWDEEPEPQHPDSDPKETQRKELTQCQHCFISQAEGAKLSRCSRCKVEMYCSKECQKQAWKSHKEKCDINVRIQENGEPGSMDAVRRLQQFSNKHRWTLREAACRAMDLGRDPSRGLKDILCVFLRARKNASRKETWFYTIGAEVATIEEFFPPAQAAEVKGMLKTAYDKNIEGGGAGAAYVMMCGMDSRISNFLPVGFGPEVYDMEPGQEWLEWMVKRLNEGIVV